MHTVLRRLPPRTGNAHAEKKQSQLGGWADGPISGH